MLYCLLSSVAVLQRGFVEGINQDKCGGQWLITLGG